MDDSSSRREEERWLPANVAPKAPGWRVGSRCQFPGDPPLGVPRRRRTEALRQVTFATSIQHGAGGGTGIVATAVARTDSVYPRTDPRYEKALIENIYDLRIKHFERKRDRELAKHLKTAADNSNNIATKRLPVERSDAL